MIALPFRRDCPVPATPCREAHKAAIWPGQTWDLPLTRHADAPAFSLLIKVRGRAALQILKTDLARRRDLCTLCPVFLSSLQQESLLGSTKATSFFGKNVYPRTTKKKA